MSHYPQNVAAKADLIDFGAFQRARQASGPAATQMLLNYELAPGITVHDAAWTFAMPAADYAVSDNDPETMASLLFDAGLHFFGGNHDQPDALVVFDENRFNARFRDLGCREQCLTALGKGILIKRRVEWCC